LSEEVYRSSFTEESGETSGVVCLSACPHLSCNSSFDKMTKPSTASLETADTKRFDRRSFSRRTEESFSHSGSERLDHRLTGKDKPSTASLETADTKRFDRRSFSRRTGESFSHSGSERFDHRLTGEGKESGDTLLDSAGGRTSLDPSDVPIVFGEMPGRRPLRCLESEHITSSDSVRQGEEVIDAKTACQPRKPEGRPGKSRMFSFLQSRRTLRPSQGDHYQR
jgi:hypothetical protein